ncbi:Nuclear fragile X mental retardation-interacting protein 1 [Pseudolycoriella hygida]|uniref:Nuclear fragile X mental retardation-interacting protein 1 n=1 Tax=Pseudolycoriella hygida TaxID=35572 RepID=A0A9Q0S8R5_9DIPT|nr:Nuclear fragile X mental retardation-interacting protein 1 [Pseudolycoriella hygida]
MTDHNFVVPSNKTESMVAKKLPCPFSPSGMMQPSYLQPPPMFGPRGSTIPPKHLASYAHFTINRSQPRTRVNNRNFNRPSRPKDSPSRYPNRDVNTNSDQRYHKSREFWCEPCDRDFPSGDKLQEHKSQHQKCGIDGCKFEGHEIIVNKHIHLQHSSGLYDRLKNLETPEDIQKWREERRKRYPTKANIELRQQMQKARFERGEKLNNPNGRFGRPSDRKRCNPMPSDKRSPTDKTNVKKKRRRMPAKKTVSNIEEPKDEDENNESESNDGMPMFRGTSKLKKYKNRREVQPKNALTLLGNYESNSESNESSSDDSESEEKTEVLIPKSMSMSEKEYTEKSCSDERIRLVNNPIAEEANAMHSNVESSTEMDFDEKELPSEEAIIRVDKLDDVSTSLATSKVTKNNNTKATVIDKRLSKRPTIMDLSKKYRNQNTMLEKLLQNDIRHERNVLLQCVRHVVKENFFGIGQKP